MNIRSGAVALLLSLIGSLAVNAQSTRPAWEAGGVVGRFSGASVKAYPAPSNPKQAIDIQASVNAKDYVQVRLHVISESPVSDSPLVFFMGPGISLGSDDSELFLGPAAEIGVFFSIARYRVFLQAMPQMHLTPRLDGTILAAVGMRLAL